jgi:hypothetical protein
MMRLPSIAVITRPTRMQGLLARWATKGAAKFRLGLAHVHEQSRSAPNTRRSRKGATAEALAATEFDEYEAEDQVYQDGLEKLKMELDLGFPLTFVDRSFVPNYDFSRCVTVVVVGQDGLVANAAKYVRDVPIVALNPDPQRIDGILLPFHVEDARRAVQLVLKDRARIRDVTLAEVNLNDGQRMLAFNDFFVGCNGHASARYVLTVRDRTESHSSSGMIIATGAGSTGWLSSIFNMMNGFNRWLGGESQPPLQMTWEDRRLAWAVREPFVSKQSAAELVAGLLDDGQELVVESLMPGRGVIFSDGVESDFLEFNSGTIARITQSAQRARLVVG